MSVAGDPGAELLVGSMEVRSQGSVGRAQRLTTWKREMAKSQKCTSGWRLGESEQHCQEFVC